MAIAFDAQSQVDATGTSISVSHTCTGSELILFAGIYFDGGSVSAMTYNSVAMTLVDVTASGAGGDVAVYYLVNPATGSNTLAATTTASSNSQLRGASYTGASSTGQPDNSADSTPTSTTPGATMTSVADNCWHGMFVRLTQSNPVANVGTIRTTGGVNSVFVDNNAAITPAGANSLSVTQSPSGISFIVDYTFKPPGAAAAGLVTKKLLMGVGA